MTEDEAKRIVEGALHSRGREGSDALKIYRASWYKEAARAAEAEASATGKNKLVRHSMLKFTAQWLRDRAADIVK
jgi:hypothetical protein